MELTYNNRREHAGRSHRWTLWLREPYDGPKASLYADFNYCHVGLTARVGGEDTDISLTFGLGFYMVASLRFLPWSFRSVAMFCETTLSEDPFFNGMTNLRSQCTP